eukprot:scaffold3970_cov257-Pinguiococcus_pyrenoidosus.AAC.13
MPKQSGLVLAPRGHPGGTRQHEPAAHLAACRRRWNIFAVGTAAEPDEGIDIRSPVAPDLLILDVAAPKHHPAREVQDLRGALRGEGQGLREQLQRSFQLHPLLQRL